MTDFMNEDFLLKNDTAKWLYHTYAEKMPIIDYHCHISPRQIAENKPLGSIAQVWLGGDHYKWRVMRAAGIPEERITGNASDWEKFYAFASMCPQLIGNPIYHWNHLELRRAFGVMETLNAASAEDVYAKCNAVLETATPRDLMERFHVRAICTTDDPCDDLSWHEMIRQDPGMTVRVLPAFRPDAYINIEKPGFRDAMTRLARTTGRALKTARDVADALLERIDYFAARGCLASDHGMDYCMYAEPDEDIADRAFHKAMGGENPEASEGDAFKTFVTIACAKRYKELNWVMQIHFGVLRNANAPQFRKLGPDTGYDCINSRSGVENLAPLLSAFAENEGLPKMVLYSLNPADNTAVASIAATFQGDGIPGRIQMGTAWWFNDHIKGMRAQLEDLAANGVLAQFVGMLTDSRSLLSYTRHEYFRRVLCNLLGTWVEDGEYPNDPDTLGKLVEDICYNNTLRFFGFDRIL